MILKNTLERFHGNDKLISNSLHKTNNEYRALDPGLYLYRQLMQTTDVEIKFKTDFIELVYVTLVAWNMNSRGAKLSKFTEFEKSIKRNQKIISRISNEKMDKKIGRAHV